MMKKVGKMMAMALILMVVFLLGSMPAEAKMIPKVTNFVVLVDQSGSMFLKHAKEEEVKAVLAKRVLLALNERIPELGYKGAIQVFAPDKTLIGPERYNRSSFRNSLQGLPESGKIFDDPRGVKLPKIFPDSGRP